ncbi:Fic family protein [Metamycoplasma alkalescens]|nr:Fic family protein [Metamycoplasma alkalescens]
MMRNFDYSKINEIKWDSEILSLITAIYHYKGKTEFFIKQESKKLDQLVENTKNVSTMTSNEIEGIITTTQRFKKIMANKILPRNKNEKEIVGYKEILNIINDNFEDLPLSKNYILQMHKIMLKYTNNPLAGKIKNVQNYITINYADGNQEILFKPISPFETPIALEKICDEFNQAINNFLVEPLILIPIFIHDFLCIHPFNDGNGRISRLLTTLLLYKSGFFVSKYVSLESLIANTKIDYYQALQIAGINWHEEKEDVIPFIKYILGIILAGYKELKDKSFVIEEKLLAIDIVRKAISLKMGSFSKQDICELCPTLSLSSIERSLRNLVQLGEIKLKGIGKKIRYTKLK